MTADAFIAERAPRLTGSPLWPVVRPALYKLLNYRHAVRMADAVSALSGAEALAYMSDLLDLKVSVLNAERIPASGRCVVVANHPTGIADGIAVHDAIRARRADAGTRPRWCRCMSPGRIRVCFTPSTGCRRSCAT